MKNQRRFISAMIVTIVAVFIFGRLNSRKKKGSGGECDFAVAL